MPGGEGKVHIAEDKDDGSWGEKQRLTIDPAILQSLSSASKLGNQGCICPSALHADLQFFSVGIGRLSQDSIPMFV